MLPRIPSIRQSLAVQLILWVGLILLGCISTWAYLSIRYHKQNATERTIAEAERLGNTILLGTHYAMTLNSRDDINQIIRNISRQREIRNVRIYNKNGEIKYSNVPSEVDQSTDIRAEACIICHRTEPPSQTVPLSGRIRMLSTTEGGKHIGIISPIYNEAGCATPTCHYHPADKRVLGALDVVISLDETYAEILSQERGIIALASGSFVAISTIIGIFLFNFVTRPIKGLIDATRQIGRGQFEQSVDRHRPDEIGQLAQAIQKMKLRIAEKQEELNRQRTEYQTLFEQVPCYITVQDRQLNIITYNQETAKHFNPQPGTPCYTAYKGLQTQCEPCPVLQTFEDGNCHGGEQRVINRDGSETYWFVRTTPIRRSPHEVEAVMEISLDITQIKRLEKEIRLSEQKYHTIFNNIPNAVFVVDRMTLEILDCNPSASTLYGYDRRRAAGLSYLELFVASEREQYREKLREVKTLSQVRQMRSNGEMIYVDMHLSPSEYLDREALLIVASDITKRLLAEQHLIQASKMATLGEMSAGVAHELNQPLSVIKTASSYLAKKVKKGAPISDDVLRTMSEEIDSHVDRASKIINHLRDFGRKSDVSKEPVQVNDPLNRACEMFDQQLRVRDIKVVKNLDVNLPLILADPNRLEQVFINLLINARDAIEERGEREGRHNSPKVIELSTRYDMGKVRVEVSDTGSGIPDSIRDKIFEPFFTTKKVGQGTGLGLSISYGIVQDYQGTIRVESRENEGSKFILEFPVSDSVP